MTTLNFIPQGESLEAVVTGILIGLIWVFSVKSKDVDIHQMRRCMYTPKRNHSMESMELQ